MGSHGACGAETGWCTTGPTTSWGRTNVYKKHVGMVRTSQLGSLTSASMSPGVTNAGACALPWEQTPLPPPTSAECESRGTPVSQTPQDDTQTPTEVTLTSGMDIARDLAPCQRENCSATGPGKDIHA